MNTRNRAPTISASIASIVVPAVIGLFLIFPEPADAHQPEGLRVSQTSVDDYPCAHGDDPAGEATSAPPSPNPYQGVGPDTPLDPDIIGDPHPRLADSPGLRAIRYVRAGGDMELKRSSGSAGAGSGDANGAGSVRAALTSETTSLPWVADSLTGRERATRDLLAVLQGHGRQLVSPR